jgi:hypothetical protein
MPWNDAMLLSVASGRTTAAVSPAVVATIINGPAAPSQLVLASGLGGYTGGKVPCVESVRLAPLSRQLPSVIIATANAHTLALITDNLPATRASVEYEGRATSMYVFMWINSWCRVTRARNATRNRNGIRNSEQN